MKILSCSDLHVDSRNPKYRIGNYEDEIFQKLEWLVNKAIKKDVKVITISGDIFEKTGVPDSVISRMCSVFKKFKDYSNGNHILTTFGQHDLRYHNTDFSNTPYSIMVSSGIFTHVSEKPFGFATTKIYGAGWKERPKIPKNKNGCNVLLIHELVFKKTKEFLDENSYSLGNDVLKRYKNTDIILSGDNHDPFIIKKGKRRLINCGSICRKSKAEIDYEPCVYYIDTNSRKIKKIKIPVQKKEKVFDLKQIKIDEQKQKALEDAKPIIENFTNSLKASRKSKPSFEKNLDTVLKDKKISSEAKKLVQEVMCLCLLEMEAKHEK